MKITFYKKQEIVMLRFGFVSFISACTECSKSLYNNKKTKSIDKISQSDLFCFTLWLSNVLITFVCCCRQGELPCSTVHKVLHKKLWLFFYIEQLLKEIKTNVKHDQRSVLRGCFELDLIFSKRLIFLWFFE